MGSSWLVKTSKGEIRAEIVVNAAGQWARQVGHMVGVDLPIVPLEHHFIITDALEEVRALQAELPVLRDPEASFYVRGEGEALVVGPFERNTRPWALEGIPEDFHSTLLPPDLDRLEEVLEAAARRVPAFENAGFKNVVNGPDGYTPDGHCLMGPVPGLPNFHVLAGFSIFGIVFGGGAGKYAAEWIVEGQPSDNMWELDVRRFDEYASSTKYVAERACEVYQREYARSTTDFSRKERSLAPDSAGSVRSGSPAAARHETSTPSIGETGTLRSARSVRPSDLLSACSTRRALRSTKSRDPARRSSSTDSAPTHFRPPSAESS